MVHPAKFELVAYGLTENTSFLPVKPSHRKKTAGAIPTAFTLSAIVGFYDNEKIIRFLFVIVSLPHALSLPQYLHGFSLVPFPDIALILDKCKAGATPRPLLEVKPR